MNLKRLCNGNKITLCWVPGHNGYEGNDMAADTLARRGSESTNPESVVKIKDPLSCIYLTVERILKNASEGRWTSSLTSICTKLFFPSYDTNKTKFLLRENKSNLSKLISIITGHNLLGKHAKRLRLSEDDMCRYCRSLYCSEDTQHILCQCEAVARRRMNTLGSFFFEEEEDLSGIRLQDIKRFFANIGCNPRTVSMA